MPPYSRNRSPMQLISCSMTTPAIRNRLKTVTRRLGWKRLKAGSLLCICEKVMGRTAGTPLVRLAIVRVVDVRREQLNLITAADVEREGYPGMSPGMFVRMFCQHMGCAEGDEVTRIEFRYIPGGRLLHSFIGPSPETWMYRRGYMIENCCARCGSSIDGGTCEECCGDGFNGHDCGEDCCCCADPEQNIPCDTCRGTGVWRRCMSSPEWCESNPLPGRANIIRGQVEWFVVIDN